MTTHIELRQGNFLDRKAAQRLTEHMIRGQSKTFYFATGLLPEPQRKAIRALYAFCRATDDLVDCEDATIADLQNWHAQVNLTPEEQTDPTLFCWASVRQEYGVDRRYEQELIDGVRMDLEFRPYQTWENLEDYCYHVASTVGLLSMPIIGLAPRVSFEQAAPYAIKLGISLQLTNILRDIGEDARMRRIYLPETDLLHFGLTQQDIHNQVFDQRFIALMQFEIVRARQLYKEALPGITMLSSAVRPAVGAAAMLYATILDEIEAIHYQVYQIRAHTSTWRKIQMLPAIIFHVLSLPPVEAIAGIERYL